MEREIWLLEGALQWLSVHQRGSSKVVRMVRRIWRVGVNMVRFAARRWARNCWGEMGLSDGGRGEEVSAEDVIQEARAIVVSGAVGSKEVDSDDVIGVNFNKISEAFFSELLRANLPKKGYGGIKDHTHFF